MITPILAETSGALSEPYFDMVKVFQGSPFIYTILILMSIGSLTLWIYSIFTLKLSEMMPSDFLTGVKERLASHRYEEAQQYCIKEKNMSAEIIGTGISVRRHGPQVVIEAMRAEGRRIGNLLWQRISILNEIAIVAPMLGLLGTVLGLFFAFYDSNRTPDSIASIFDGLGIAVGTTVVGLIVAILAMIFYTTLKFRVVNILNSIENESLSIAYLIDAGEEPRKNHEDSR